MVLQMFEKCKNQYLDSLELVILDWNVLGVFCGFRHSEWEQKASDKKQTLESSDGLPLAFILPDLTFLNIDQHTIPQSWSSKIHDAVIEFVQLQW